MRLDRIILLPVVLLLGACDAITGEDGPDRDPPTLAVAGLRSGDTVSTPTLQLDVTAEDEDGVVERLAYALNGGAETDLPGANHAARVALRMQDLAVREGANQLVLSAYDDAGNRGSLELSFVLAYWDSVATVAIEPDSVRLAWATQTRLRVVVRNPSGRALDFRGPVAWSSSDTSVVAVGDSGTVTARAAGSATLTVTAGGKTDQARVTVPFAFTLAALEAPADRRAYGMAINDAGQAVGYANKFGTSTYEALLWDGGRMTTLGEGQAHDVNARGQVVGSSTEAGGGGLRGPSTLNAATLWSGGTRTLLAQGDTMVQGGSTRADAINDAGDVVVTWRSGWIGSGGQAAGRVFLYRGGRLREVMSGTNAEGKAINQAGWITGSLGPLERMNMDGFLWRDGATTVVGRGAAVANDVNTAGHVVGGPYRASLWRDGSTTYAFPADSLGRVYASSEAEAINDRGDVVGWFGGFRGDANSRAFVWSGGTATDLNRLFAAGDWIFQRATDVNNRGQIVGYGRHRTTGEIRALRADPLE